MRKLAMTAAAVALSIIPALAGALIVDFGSPGADAEAVASGAVAVARITSCVHPGKIVMSATAEGVVDGKRQSIPLRLVPLKQGEKYAVMRSWPEKGSWVVKIVLTHPEYDYSPAVIVPVRKGDVDWAGVQHFRRVPSEQDVASVLSQNGL